MTVKNRKKLLLVAIAMAFLVSGCRKEDEAEKSDMQSGSLSIEEQKIINYKLGDWLHDVDEARRIRDMLVKGQINQDNVKGKINLLSAVAGGLPAEIAQSDGCWPRHETYRNSFSIKTATTDHACLDRNGYRRSR